MLFVVDFARAGNSAAHRVSGWSSPEQQFVWAIGPESVLHLPPRAESGPLVLDLDANPALVPDLILAQPLEVLLNGVSLGSVLLRGLTRARFPVPAGCAVAGAPLTVTLRHPGYARLDWAGAGDDDRALAVSVFALRLYPAALQEEIDRTVPPVRPHAKLLRAAAPRPAAGGIPGRLSVELGAAVPPDIVPLEGWRQQDGTWWTAARVARLELPAAPAGAALFLRLHLEPLRINVFRPAQRLMVLLDGIVLGQFRLGQQTVLGFPLPTECGGGERMVLTLVSPDAWPMDQFADPTDTARIGFALHAVACEPVTGHLVGSLPPRSDAVRAPLARRVSEAFLDTPLDALPEVVAATLGVSLDRILRDFESLGDNCGFGLAQRKGGVEVLGLLRFANTPLASFLRGMDDGFAATSNRDEVRLEVPAADDHEYMLHVDRYGIRWHTMVHRRDADPDAVFDQQAVKLGYLRRKFHEGLRAGRKVYVLARAEPRKVEVVAPAWQSLPVYEELPDPLGQAEALTAFLALNRDRPNTLLYLVPCTDGRPSGAVEQIAPGLLRGHLGRFAISNQTDIRDHADWLRIVANAWRLLHGDAAAGETTSAAA